MYNLLVYFVVLIIVIWAMDGININYLFKKNRVLEARVIYVIIIFSLTYASSSFIIEFLNSLKP